MEQIFLNQVAIITGAGSGIGEATSILFSKLGAKVIISDINETDGNRVANNIINSGGDALFVKTDVSIAEDCQNLVNIAIQKFGRLDIAFNNAGIGGESNMTADMSIEGWHKVINTNLNSVFYCMKYQLLEMQKNGKGAIVNMSSILGSVGFAGASAYVASKHGVVGLTQNAAIEYATKGIRINVVGPAFIDTPLLAKAGINDEMKSGLISLHPIGRLGKSEEVAELVVWLCSDKASFVTGSYYPIDGGYLDR